MCIHRSNKTDKRINVSKIANTSTLGDDSTAAGCNHRLITVLVAVGEINQIREELNVCV